MIEQHGRLDILVNNAGITMDRTVRKMAPEEWSHVIEVNLNGAFYMSRAVLSHMIDQGYGRIIHISSVIGETGNIGQANYAAAKSGLFGFTMSLALECANKGITVNCVAPASSRLLWSPPYPRSCSTESSRRFRPVGLGSRTRWRAWSSFSPIPTRATSPARPIR